MIGFCYSNDYNFKEHKIWHLLYDVIFNKKDVHNIISLLRNVYNYDNNTLLYNTILLTPNEQHELYTILTMFVSKYIRYIDSDKSDTNNIYVIPKEISIPLLEICDILGVKPIITHAAVDLYNFKFIDETLLGEDKYKINNLQSLYTFTGSKDEERFYLTMVSVELLGAEIMDKYNELIEYCNNINKFTIEYNKRIGVFLLFLNNKLHTMLHELYKLNTKTCNPDMFFNIIRPYLQGNTIYYINKGGDEVEYNLIGGSAAQSSIIQFIDIICGIKLNCKYLKDIRNYMPLKDKQFLELVEKKDTIKKLINRGDIFKCPFARNNKLYYNNIIDTIISFRKYHFNLTKLYIKRFIVDKNVIGTGGTEFEQLLSNIITATKTHKYNIYFNYDDIYICFMLIINCVLLFYSMFNQHIIIYSILIIPINFCINLLYTMI